MTCRKKLKISLIDENLVTYYNLCHNILYLCELFEKPKEKDFTSINLCRNILKILIGYLLL